MPKFGTSGLRGLAVELTDAVVADYTTAFLSTLHNNGPLLVGRDLRDSSPRLMRAVAAGARRAGVEAIDCGILPTPALALASSTRRCPAIMVTGSHIPPDRNGLKFYTPDGEITKADETRISGAKDALRPQGTAGFVELARDAGVLQAFRERYRIFFSDCPLTGLRIGVYQHSSVARDLLVDLMADAGAVAVPLGRSESFVAIDTEAVDPSARSMLASWVAEHRLDAIISTDGDADRPMLANEKGQIVPGDLIGPVAARFLGASTIVTPVSSNTVVEKCGYFDHVHRCRIGSPYVIAGMERLNGAVAGYEANGGFLLGFEATRMGAVIAPLMTRDFALPLLAFLCEAAQAKQSVSALVGTLPPRFTATDRLTDADPPVSARIVSRLLAGDTAMLPCGERGIAETDTTDGARLTLGSGRVIHVRPSGNAPELRCYVEAESTDAATDLLASMLDILGNTLREPG